MLVCAECKKRYWPSWVSWENVLIFPTSVVTAGLQLIEYLATQRRSQYRQQLTFQAAHVCHLLHSRAIKRDSYIECLSFLIFPRVAITRRICPKGFSWEFEIGRFHEAALLSLLCSCFSRFCTHQNQVWFRAFHLCSFIPCGNLSLSIQLNCVSVLCAIQAWFATA